MPNCHVVSFEPSPNSLPYLKKTHENSALKNRWKLVEKAVGETSGTVDFSVNAEADGAFDGRQATGRKASVSVTTVPMTTVDDAWIEMKKPNLDVIKIDVEGFEKEVLVGASNCLAENQPIIILEWSRNNLDGLGRDSLELIRLAAIAGYEVINMDSRRHVPNETILDFELLSVENFILFPKRK